MTVWIVAQPTRGMLIGKCLSRLAGTAVGALVALVLVRLMGISPVGFLVALAAWVGACAAFAGILTSFRAYAAVLAGFTASLVALVALPHPEHAAAMAGFRVACITIGILASALMTWLSTPATELGLLRKRAERTADEACRWIAALLSGKSPDKELLALETRVVADMAVIDSQIDQGSMASARWREERRLVRGLLGSMLNAMAAARALAAAHTDAALKSLLAGVEPTPQAMVQALAGQLSPAARSQVGNPRPNNLTVAALHGALGGLAADLHLFRSSPRPGGIRPGLDVVAHRDWQDALRAGARTFIVLLAVGTAWLVTRLPLLAMALMGASILCSVFSTMEAPKTSILLAVKGTAAGTVAAIACALGLLVFVESLPVMLLAIAPFMFVGGLALSDRRTAAVGMEYSMVFLLVAAPALPYAIERAHFLAMAPGPLLGALVAAAAFHFILPTDPLRRIQDVHAVIAEDLRGLADLGRDVSEERWRAKALHRALRLVLRTSAAGRDTGESVRVALASINLGRYLLALRGLLREHRAAGDDDARVLRSLLGDLAAGKASHGEFATRFGDLARWYGSAARSGTLSVTLSELLNGAGTALAALHRPTRGTA